MVYIILGTTVLNTFFNDSFWLIDNGNGGFVGREIKENIYYFTPLIENQYVIYSLSLLTIVFFILSLSMKPNEITIILLLPFAIIKKMASLFNKSKKNTNVNTDISNVHLEQQNYEKNTSEEKQPILPFSKKKK